MSGPFPELRDPASRRVATVVAVTFGVALCVLALFLAFRALGGGGGSDAAAPAGAEQVGGDAPAEGDASGEDGASGEDAGSEGDAADAVAFSSPTGNIGCTLSTAGARCDIEDRSWEPPAKPDSCSQDWGRGLTVTADGVSFTCSSESVLGSSQVLEYEQELSRGDFTCLSTESGMRCASASGAGFVIARGSYEVL